jgi:hypothetical protein
MPSFSAGRKQRPETRLLSVLLDNVIIPWNSQTWTYILVEYKGGHMRALTENTMIKEV